MTQISSMSPRTRSARTQRSSTQGPTTQGPTTQGPPAMPSIQVPGPSSELQERWPGLFEPPRAPLAARVARAIMRSTGERLPVQVRLADGKVIGAGGPESPQMCIHRPDAFFHRVGADLRVGFGEAYMVGDWAPGPGTDLADLLTPFAKEMASLVPRPLQRLRRLVDKRMPVGEVNTHDGARRNIQRHYDLSNELFAKFLDESMSYSSAWFGEGPPDATDLHQAQIRKIEGILDYARVGHGSRVLEIGTGWGALAIAAARRGAHVVTVTLSGEQLAFAERRIKEAGLRDRIDVRLQDYRDVSGQFDAVVSVEMIEAVGEEYWPTYFAKIDQVLAPGGRVAIQAITMSHERLLRTRRSYGWVHKYIFPGGLIPSLQAIEETLARHTRLRVAERRELGWHYAETLRQWRTRFLANWGNADDLGFDEVFKRMWEFYLAYSEAGFRSGYLGVSQLAMVEPPASSAH